jgi:hypothetical protein
MLESNRAERSRSEAKTTQSLDMLVARMQDFNRLLSAEAKPDSMNEKSATAPPKTRRPGVNPWNKYFFKASMMARRVPQRAVGVFTKGLSSCDVSRADGALDEQQAREASRNCLRKIATGLIRTEESADVDPLVALYFSSPWTTPPSENTPELTSFVDDLTEIARYLPLDTLQKSKAITSQILSCTRSLLQDKTFAAFLVDSVNTPEAFSRYGLEPISSTSTIDYLDQGFVDFLSVCRKSLIVLAFQYSSPSSNNKLFSFLLSCACMKICKHCKVLPHNEAVPNDYIIALIQASSALLNLASKQSVGVPHWRDFFSSNRIAIGGNSRSTVRKMLSLFSDFILEGSPISSVAKSLADLKKSDGFFIRSALNPMLDLLVQMFERQLMSGLRL